MVDELVLLITIHFSGLPVHELVGKIFHTTLSVIAPAKDCGESEGERTESEQWLADIRDLGECHFGKYTTIRHVDVGICNNGRDDDDTRNGTDDYGIPECA